MRKKLAHTKKAFKKTLNSQYYNIKNLLAKRVHTGKIF